MTDGSISERFDEEELENMLVDERLDRRALLRLTGASSLTGAMLSIAGCTGGDDDDSGSGDHTTTATEATDTNGGTQDDGDIQRERMREIDLVTWTQSRNPGEYQVSTTFAQNLENIGIPVNVDPQQFPQPMLSTIFDERSFDLVNWTLWGSGYRLDPSFYMNTCLHSENASEGGWNVSGYNNPSFDEVSSQINTVSDQQERQELTHRAQEISHKERAWFVYASPDLLTALNTNRFEMPSGGAVPGEGFWSIFHEIMPKGDASAFKMVRATEGGIETLNPITVEALGEVRIVHQMYDTLTAFDAEGKASPWIIEEPTIQDETTIQTTLLEGLTFHDGEPVTAEDVKFSFDYQKEHDAVFVSEYLEPVESVEVNDERTVTFNLKEPYAPFLTLTLGQVLIIPKHIWEDESNPNNVRNDQPIGSGPFRLTEWQEQQALHMEAVKDHPAEPEIDNLQISLFANRSAALEALLNGQVDAMIRVPTAGISDLENSDTADLVVLNSHGVDQWQPNERRGMPFSDPAFRHAIAHVIPYEGIREQIYNGYCTTEATMISQANEFWHNPEIQRSNLGIEYDPEKARSLLRSAGYDWDDDERLLVPSEPQSGDTIAE
jgi:peptide/nickel transport system substrate-binding protein